MCLDLMELLSFVRKLVPPFWCLSIQNIASFTTSPNLAPLHPNIKVFVSQ